MLKEGLKQLRISVEGMVAVEDMQERGRQAYIEEGKRDDIPMELKKSDLSEIASQRVVSDEEGNESARSRSGMLKGG